MDTEGSGVVTPQQQAGVGAAESERIDQSATRMQFPRAVRHVVEIAFRVRRVQVDGTGHYAGLERLGGENTGYSAGCAEQVADLGFHRRNGDVPRMGAEHGMDGAGFAHVVGLGGGAVSTDMVHFLRRGLGVFQSAPHGRGHAVARLQGRHNMIGVVRRAESAHFGVNLCPV